MTIVFVGIEIPDSLLYPDEEDVKYEHPVTGYLTYQDDCALIDVSRETYIKLWVPKNMPNHKLVEVRGEQESGELSFLVE